MNTTPPPSTHTLAQNLVALRTHNGYTQERVAAAAGVSRQAVAKWERGESTPDILHCNALCELYGVSLDDLVHYDQQARGGVVPPKGKHIFGMVQLGERGQIVIPKKARDIFGLQPGSTLMVLGDTNPGTAGIALIPGEAFMELAQQLLQTLPGKEESE